jgi:hypothetical protein
MYLLNQWNEKLFFNMIGRLVCFRIRRAGIHDRHPRAETVGGRAGQIGSAIVGHELLFWPIPVHQALKLQLAS